MLSQFCQRSLEDEKHPPEGGGEEVQKPPDEGAEEEEIPGGPQEEGGGGVETDLAVFPEGGGEKEGQADRQPEEEVQGPPEGTEGGQKPGQAEQVIQQAQGRPGGQAQEKDLGLEEGGKAHPRKRRLRKLPWRGSSSS